MRNVGSAEKEERQEQVEPRQATRVLGAAEVNRAEVSRSSSGRTTPTRESAEAARRARRGERAQAQEAALGQEEDAERAGHAGVDPAPQRLPAADPKR